MNLCENCFNDEEIQTSIRNHNQKGDCELCGAQNLYIINIDEFDDFFNEILNLFEINENGVDIVTSIQSEWDLFSNSNFANQILKYFIEKHKISYALNDKVAYINEIHKYTAQWAELKHEIRVKTRFYSSLMAYFDENGSLLKSNMTLEMGSQFYRARIIPAGKSYLTKKDMGCPPAERASSGRANPIGIPYLYLCKLPDTTLYETRAVYLNKVTIGTFRLVKNLDILDFTASTSLFLAFNEDVELREAIAQHLLRQQISKDLSKPLRRYDTELEYVPTQSVCEYCKLKDIDGIIFRSSLHKDGLNLVLFDAKNAECIRVKTVEVDKVEIAYK